MLWPKCHLDYDKFTSVNINFYCMLSHAHVNNISHYCIMVILAGFGIINSVCQRFLT